MKTRKDFFSLTPSTNPILTKRKIFQSIEKQIKKSKRILVSGHIGPDFDSIGGSLGLYFLLKDLKKQVFLGTEFKEQIWLDFESDLPKSAAVSKAKRIDLAILIDYGNKDRLPKKARKIIEKDKPIVISIDHHNLQTQFGETVWISSDYCSVAEMVYELIKKLGWKLTDKIAYYLLLGVVGDTTGFSYYPLTQKRLRMLKDLIRSEEEFSYFLNLSKKWLSFEDLIKFGKYLRKVKIAKDLGLAYLTVEHNSEVSYLYSRLSAQISLVDGVKISLLLSRQRTGLVKGELRGSRDNFVDLSQIASVFGGGGHFNAAGFISDLSSAKIIKKIKDLLKEQAGQANLLDS
ncbi:MAG: DHH family phosphoesterase [Patescibacteria group bacterium]